MARVYPFRAWRFSASPVRLQDVGTQSYERISPPIERAFHRRSSFNPVPILLELPEFFDAEPGESVYCREAHDFQAWLELGILIEEKDPCIFAYAERYTPPDTDIVILPAHRFADSLKNFYPNQFAVAAREFFAVEPTTDHPAVAFRTLLGGQQGAAFVAVTRAGAWRVRSKPEAVASAWAAFPERQRQPGHCRLHSIALERLPGLSAKQIPSQANLRTASDADAAVDQFQRGEADIAFLAQPVPLKQRKQATFADDVPRRKSSAFFPKPLSGLAIYALD
jgi:hypothetical protein